MLNESKSTDIDVYIDELLYKEAIRERTNVYESQVGSGVRIPAIAFIPLIEVVLSLSKTKDILLCAQSQTCFYAECSAFATTLYSFVDNLA